MYEMYTIVGDHKDIYCKEEDIKKLWGYIRSFFTRNRLKPTKILFKDGKTLRAHKATFANFKRIAKNTPSFHVVNTNDYELNKRSIWITQK